MSAAPDYIEPLEAWRVWKVVRVDGAYRLGSVVHGTVWPAGDELRAECLRVRLFRRRRRRHDAPNVDCECGVYAAGLTQLDLYVAEGLRGPLSRVVGRVALWGTVVECERGFRASHAYPARIYVPHDAGAAWRTSWEDVALGLCAYRVPVEPLEAPVAEAPKALAVTALPPAR